MPAPLAPEVVGRIIALRATGLTEPAIARALQIAPSVVNKYLQKEENRARVADLRESFTLAIAARLVDAAPKVLDEITAQIDRVKLAGDARERQIAAQTFDALTRGAAALEKVSAGVSGEGRGARSTGATKVNINVEFPAWLRRTDATKANAHVIDITSTSSEVLASPQVESEGAVLGGRALAPLAPLPDVTANGASHDSSEADVYTGEVASDLQSQGGCHPQNAAGAPPGGGVTFGEHCTPRASRLDGTDADVSGTEEVAGPTRPPGPAGSAEIDDGNPIPDDFEV